MKGKAMKKVIFGLLAGMFLLPATSFANDFHPPWRNSRDDHVYGDRDRPWFESGRRGFWHLHRVRRRNGHGYNYFYHWHPAEQRYQRYDNRWDRPGYRFDD
jgi:hypothetical protein